ncbi:hypothetical protein CHS0354_010099 [Potamilus streckersoni]|uniref:RRM domain-containing protein n=1 Tax=Potamilus streckersoni TaxID=2493646 RepID=A0AAE0VIC4_9BIVA|nr:hypothetical protein CHS0354_010099 [Potamilus streckersoni]
MADAATVKAESVESEEIGSVQENSTLMTVEKDVESTTANSPPEIKDQDLHEVVLKEKVLSDEAEKEQESKENNEESGEENGSKDEEWMVVDEDDDVDELDESIEIQEKELGKEEGNEKMDQVKEGQQERPPRTLLATITVNIGPLRMEDLDSPQMRDILNYSKGYTLTFEKKEDGLLSKEKERARHEGFVKIPYEFYNDAYLVKTHNKLRNLHIDNRDLSVTFPEEFLKIFEECTARIKLRQERRRKIQDMRRANVESKKKSLFAKNIPPNIEEETLKAEFPGCTNVIIPKNSEGISIGFAVLEFESIENTMKCLETRNMVEIQNHKIHLSKISLSGAPTDGSQNKGNQQRGNRGRRDQRGNRGRNQQRGNRQQRGNNQQRGNQRLGNQQRGNQRRGNQQRGNQQQNRQRNDRSRNGDRRGPRFQPRRMVVPYNRDFQMPPPLMGNISMWSRFDDSRGGGELGYFMQDNRGNGGILGDSPKRSRSPSDGRDQKRFREDSYGRMEDSRQRGDTKPGYTSVGWGGPANTGRSSSNPEGETEATLVYLKHQLAAMEKKLVHSQVMPGVGSVSSSGRTYGSGYSSVGHAGAVGGASGYVSGTHTSGYGSSVKPGISYPSSGYTSGTYSSSGYKSGSYTPSGYSYGSGGHTADSLMAAYYSAYPSGGQPRSGGGSSRIEDAYNKFKTSL